MLTSVTMKPDGIRLQKYLSERGVASRRHCAVLIADGRVDVNGVAVREPGARIDPAADSVSLDGRALQPVRQPRTSIMLYKPRGLVCSRNAAQGRTVYALLPDELRNLVPIGRLDKESEGLLLMSNDGELVNRLTHPRFGQSKTYEATVSGELTPAVMHKLCSRMVIDGYQIRPVKVRLLGQAGGTAEEEPRASTRPRTTVLEGDSSHIERHVLEFTLSEGRNRQIRNMCEQTGLRVHRLVRKAIHALVTEGLRPGQWRALTKRELLLLDGGPQRKARPK